jgi:hypothetical protein
MAIIDLNQCSFDLSVFYQLRLLILFIYSSVSIMISSGICSLGTYVCESMSMHYVEFRNSDTRTSLMHRYA